MLENSATDLFHRFIEAATQHYLATEAGNSLMANRAYSRLVVVRRHLQKEQRLAELLPLLRQTAPGPKLWAASALLGAHSEAAETALRELATLPGIISFNARMTLQEWRAGRFTP